MQGHSEDQGGPLTARHLERMLRQGWKSEKGDDDRFDSFYYTSSNSMASTDHKAAWSGHATKYQARTPTGAMRDCGDVPTASMHPNGHSFTVTFGVEVSECGRERPGRDR